MFGPVWQGAVRLTARAAHMLIAEGIETACRSWYPGARPAGEHWPSYGVWAALSLGNIAGSGDDDYFGKPHRAKRKGVRLPTVVPDMSGPGSCCRRDEASNGLRRCGQPGSRSGRGAAVARGRTLGGARDMCAIARPPAGMDFNDLLAGAA